MCHGLGANKYLPHDQILGPSTDILITPAKLYSSSESASDGLPEYSFAVRLVKEPSPERY